MELLQLIVFKNIYNNVIEKQFIFLLYMFLSIFNKY